MVGVRPLHDWLLVKLEPLPEKTRGGIILPSANEARQRVGRILRAGPGRRRWSRTLQRHFLEPLDVEVGERVVFYREHLEHQQGKSLVGVLQELEPDTGLIRPMDILFSLGHPEVA